VLLVEYASSAKAGSSDLVRSGGGAGGCCRRGLPADPSSAVSKRPGEDVKVEDRHEDGLQPLGVRQSRILDDS